MQVLVEPRVLVNSHSAGDAGAIDFKLGREVSGRIRSFSSSLGEQGPRTIVGHDKEHSGDLFAVAGHLVFSLLLLTGSESR